MRLRVGRKEHGSRRCRRKREPNHFTLIEVERVSVCRERGVNRVSPVC